DHQARRRRAAPVGFDWAEREKPIGSAELARALSPLMQYFIEQFGPDRCMFESNFPVDKVSYSYNVIYNAFKRLSEGYSAAERAAMFHDTAARVYRIANKPSPRGKVATSLSCSLSMAHARGCGAWHLTA